MLKDKDRGYKKVIKELTRRNAGVSVGIHAKDASKKEAGGRTVLEVGTWNEFGTKTIPERSFIRGWFDAFQDANRKTVTALAKRVAAGRITQEQMLGQLGALFKGQAQQRISDGIEPANAQSTIDRKGSSKPLVDSGQLKASISYEVRRD
jgi:hypothetical protein